MSWKYHGILSVRKSGNPGDHIHNNRRKDCHLSRPKMLVLDSTWW